MAVCDPCYDLMHDDEEYRFIYHNDRVYAFREWLKCNKDFTTDALPRLRGLIHASWDSFCESLDNYYPICWVVWHHIRDSPMASYRDQTHQGFFLWLDDGYFETWESGVWELKCSLKLQDSVKIELAFRRTTKQQFEDKLAQAPLEEHTGSETTLNTVKGWLSNCDGGHSKSHACVQEMRALNNPTVLTRLIDLHGHDSQAWSLIETKNQQSFSKYVTSSHRWTEHTPRLLKGNFVSFKTGQPDNVVPRNYRDVFVLCHRLDIRYVWIDSLCIFQDSAEGFLREASTMTEVYANPFCAFSVCWELRGFFAPETLARFLKSAIRPMIRANGQIDTFSSGIAGN